MGVLLLPTGSKVIDGHNTNTLDYTPPLLLSWYGVLVHIAITSTFCSDFWF